MKLLPSLTLFLIFLPFVSALAVSPPSIDFGTITGQAKGQLSIYNDLGIIQTYYLESSSIIVPESLVVSPHEWETISFAISPSKNGEFNEKIFIWEQIENFQNKAAVNIRYKAANITANKNNNSIELSMQTREYKPQAVDGVQINDKQQASNYSAEKIAFLGLAAFAGGLFIIRLKRRKNVKSQK